MQYTATIKINIYDVKIENLQSDFVFKTKPNTGDKDALLTVPNPNYKSMLSDYPHLKSVKQKQSCPSILYWRPVVLLRSKLKSHRESGR